MHWFAGLTRCAISSPAMSCRARTLSGIFPRHPLNKGQLSCREVMNGEKLIAPIKAREPLTISHIDGPYNEISSLRNLTHELGVVSVSPLAPRHSSSGFIGCANDGSAAVQRKLIRRWHSCLQGPRQDRPIWVFGAGGFGRDAAKVLRGKGFDVAGFVETTPRVAEVSGLPVVSWQQLTRADLNAQLAVGIFNRDTPMDGLHQLAASAGFQDIFFPFYYFSQIARWMGWRFWLTIERRS